MKLKDLISEYGEYEIIDKTKFKTWDATLPEEKSGSIQFESREGIEIRLEPPKTKTVWDLKDGDNYYVIDSDGNVPSCYKWIEYCCCDECEVGNVFFTREEAVQDIERRKVETLLLKYGGRRWFKEGKENWFITFDRSVCLCFFKYSIRDQRQGMIYFDTREQAENAIEAIGEDRITEALFEVR